MSRLCVGSCLGGIDLDKATLRPGGRLCVDSRKFSEDEKTMESLEDFEKRIAREYEEFYKKAEEARKIIDPYGHRGVYRLSDIGKYYRLSDIGKYYRLSSLPEENWLEDGIAKYYRLDPLPIGRGWDNDDIARINDWSRFAGGYCDENWDEILREHGMGQAYDLSGREIIFEGLQKTKKL